MSPVFKAEMTKGQKEKMILGILLAAVALVAYFHLLLKRRYAPIFLSVYGIRTHLMLAHR